jgi:hypothetical protein
MFSLFLYILVLVENYMFLLAHRYTDRRILTPDATYPGSEAEHTTICEIYTCAEVVMIGCLLLLQGKSCCLR